MFFWKIPFGKKGWDDGKPRMTGESEKTSSDTALQPFFLSGEIKGENREKNEKRFSIDWLEVETGWEENEKKDCQLGDIFFIVEKDQFIQVFH